MPIDVGMVQRRRLAAQARQVMQRIENLLPLAVTARMPRDHLVDRHHLDVLDVALDRHAPEGVDTRHAVAVVIETHRLILVHLGRPANAGVESPPRQGRRPCAIPLETDADRLRLPLLHTLPLRRTARPQTRVQFRQVLHRRHRRGPLLLQELHTPLHTRLLLRPTRQAKLRLEVVMARQCLVTLVDPPLTAHEQLAHQPRRVVPPQLARYAAVELQRLRQPDEDRLRPLRRQRDRERTVRIRPGRHQHRHLTPSLRKFDVDVPEVRFQTLPRIVVQRNVRLPQAPPMRTHVEPDPLVAAQVAVFGLQTPIQLACRMPLLPRRLLVRRHNRVDDRLVRIEHRGRRIEPQIRPRLRSRDDLPNLAPRVPKPPGQLANAHSIPMRTTHTSILVHLDHPPPPALVHPDGCTSLQEAIGGWARFRRGFLQADRDRFRRGLPIGSSTVSLQVEPQLVHFWASDSAAWGGDVGRPDVTRQ